MPDSDRKTCDRLLSAGLLAVVMPSVLGERTWSDRRSDSRENLAWNSRLDTGNKIFVFSGQFWFRRARRDFLSLLILGAFIGGIFAMAAEFFLGLDVGYMNNFVLLAMAGVLYSSRACAPHFGIILLFEMSGSVNQMLSLAIVSVSAYIAATLLKSPPIYDSLLERILEGAKSGT